MAAVSSRKICTRDQLPAAPSAPISVHLCSSVAAFLPVASSAAIAVEVHSAVDSCRDLGHTIPVMPDLNSTVSAELSRFYQEKADAILALLEPLTHDQLWARPYPYGNSIGHLLLHLTGNLNFYVGAEIAGTGYVRNRPQEFTDSERHPKALLLDRFRQAVALVRETLARQSPDDFCAAYSAKGLEHAGTRFNLFLICAAHLAHHTGQMIYLSRELERQKAGN